MFTKILKTLLKKEYSDDTDDISVHIDEYKPKKRKVLIVFDETIPDIFSDKKLQLNHLSKAGKQTVKQLLHHKTLFSSSIIYQTKFYMLLC